MAVYVDDMRAPLGRLILCHMIADSTQELLAMADRIGAGRRWIQYPGTYREHFDICLDRRALAVEAGALELTRMQLGRIVWARRPARLRRAPAGLLTGSSDCRRSPTDAGR